jgi:hypothetical protein
MKVKQVDAIDMFCRGWNDQLTHRKDASKRLRSPVKKLAYSRGRKALLEYASMAR